MASAGFSCQHCSKWFRTDIGLGVHTQSQYRAKYEATIQIPKSKIRYSSEELAIMAMSKTSLIKQLKTLVINTVLLSLFPNRTREAIKGLRRQRKYKNLVAEYIQAGSSVATLGPVPSTSYDFSTHSLASTSSVVTSSNSEAVPTNRPVTRRQKRIVNAAAQTSLSPEPPDPPIALSPSSSDSSSVIAMDDPELSLSFNKDLEIDSESIAVPSETIIDSSLDALQVVREVRTDMEAANISLMELSVVDSIRQDIASTPETAFSFDNTDSKFIDYLDLLFDTQNLLYQHSNGNIFPNTSLCNTR
ncbi:hypothetical protein AVEN_210740-1 [Araneus ventricosus]|uniref:Uncharacterized protein n=1 Tax=Araneus ventricosus TaxID=182803 RepID=A0A4Y2UIQ0_ARAVE|nr:hypothetical protein AVEN_210740-1 [Araneus ventricosus]